MSTPSSTRRLFAGLLDDAAMFPPGNAGADRAILEHLRHRRSWYADLVGPLLVHGDRWHEFLSAHAAAGSPEVGVVVVATTRRPERVPERLHVVGYEAVTQPPFTLPDDGMRTAVEIVDPDRRDDILDAVAAARAAGLDVIAKYRTGGESADAFPVEETVADLLASAVTRGVPLKFTAGLHHAIRRTDPETGFERHGFLNLMAATKAIQDRVHAAGAAPADPVEPVPVLACRDVDGLVVRVRGWSLDDVVAVRQSFVSFGCCGVGDPIGDLTALGLVDEEPR